MATIADLANAIARFEGFLVPGSIAQRDNNPGNLRAGPGQVGTDSGGYAIFPDVATGQAALERQIQLNIDRGLTLDQFFGGLPGVYSGYAPAADKNNPGQYSATVAGWLGIDNKTPLSQVIGGGSSAAASDLTGDTSGGSTFSSITDSITGLWDGSALQDVESSTGLSGLAWAGLATVFLGVLYLTSRDA